jgi:endoglucanase
MEPRACTGLLLFACLLAGCSGADGVVLLTSSSPQDGGGVDTGAPAADGGAVLDGGASDAEAPIDAAMDDGRVMVESGAAVDATLGVSDVDASAAPADGVAGEEAGYAGEASTPEEAATTIAPLPSLHVVGNRIYDNATPVQLTGVHRAGTEYSCVHNTGIFDGPSDVASIQAIKTWSRANAVRVPLNEDCWLGINGVSSQYSGSNYQTAVAGYVTLLLENGLYPILDLHWSAAGTQMATGQAPMPDQDHSPAFWSQVATLFKDNLGVAFDLFNEPDPGSGQETADAWTCWRDGTTASGDAGSCAGLGYDAAGMQALVSAVRSAGANNLVLLGGVVSANALSQWTLYRPDDPSENLAAAWHVYSDRPCSSTSCFDSKVGPVAQTYPVVATELGEKDCQGTFITTAMDWLDSKQQSYLAFTWDTWSNCQSLISDYTGTPTTPYGLAYKTHLMSLADGGGD